MDAQHQPVQGQEAMSQAYYQPPHVPGSDQMMGGGAPQAIGYPPGQQQQFARGNGYGNAYPAQAVGYAHTAPTAPAPTGAKRSTCLALLAATVVLLVAVIGLSAGLGVSQRDLHNTQADLADLAQSPPSVSIVTVTATRTVIGSPTSATSSSASASATVDVSNITCPKSNNTLYTAATADSSTKQFREYCGIDYSGDESQDVGSVKVTSMDACMDACAAQSNCTGAGWGYIGGDNGAEHTCYMKGNLTSSHTADSGWAFGILLTSPDASAGRRRSVWPLDWRA